MKYCLSLLIVFTLFLQVSIKTAGPFFPPYYYPKYFEEINQTILSFAIWFYVVKSCHEEDLSNEDQDNDDDRKGGKKMVCHFFKQVIIHICISVIAETFEKELKNKPRHCRSPNDWDSPIHRKKKSHSCLATCNCVPRTYLHMKKTKKQIWMKPDNILTFFLPTKHWRGLISR